LRLLDRPVQPSRPGASHEPAAGHYSPAQGPPDP
jgi:hypothetical protein